jgi:hypothetical protein
MDTERLSPVKITLKRPLTRHEEIEAVDAFVGPLRSAIEEF